jgi:hypothetical protein
MYITDKPHQLAHSQASHAGGGRGLSSRILMTGIILDTRKT